jgi:hypothetical protein
MGFSLQWVGPYLHWLTLGVLCVLPVLAAYAIYKLGSLPGAIARARGHPQADAVNICGWMGVITLVLWPLAMVWAHWSPAKPTTAGRLSENDIDALTHKLQQTSRRLAAIEDALSDHGPQGSVWPASDAPVEPASPHQRTTRRA